MLRPIPPDGGNLCAASPASNTRLNRYESANCDVIVHEDCRSTVIVALVGAIALRINCSHSDGEICASSFSAIGYIYTHSLSPPCEIKVPPARGSQIQYRMPGFEAVSDLRSALKWNVKNFCKLSGPIIEIPHALRTLLDAPSHAMSHLEEIFSF